MVSLFKHEELCGAQETQNNLRRLLPDSHMNILTVRRYAELQIICNISICCWKHNCNITVALNSKSIEDTEVGYFVIRSRLLNI